MTQAEARAAEGERQTGKLQKECDKLEGRKAIDAIAKYGTISRMPSMPNMAHFEIGNPDWFFESAHLFLIGLTFCSSTARLAWL